MLVSFSAENFLCIRDRARLDMRRLSLSEHRSSLIDNALLPAAAIYGPNGGGKTSLMRALGFFRGLVAAPYPGYGEAAILPLLKPSPVPFLPAAESGRDPVVFEFVLRLNGSLYRIYTECGNGVVEYEILQRKGPRGKPATIYERIGTEIVFRDRLLTGVKRAAISPEVSALPYADRLYGVSPVREISGFLGNCAVLDCGLPGREETIGAALRLAAGDGGLRAEMLKTAALLCPDAENFRAVFKGSPESGYEIRTVHKTAAGTYELPLTAESAGIRKLFDLLPLIVRCLSAGGVLAVDDLDANLHPGTLRRIIELFTDRKSNPGGGQLIFTAHDLSVMNSSVFRRDEIWFAAGDGGGTKLYSLADVRDEDGECVRPDAVYSKQYLEGRYGAVPRYGKGARRRN